MPDNFAISVVGEPAQVAPSTILCSGGALRDRATLSKTANFGKVAFKPSRLLKK